MKTVFVRQAFKGAGAELICIDGAFVLCKTYSWFFAFDVTFNTLDTSSRKRS